MDKIDSVSGWSTCGIIKNQFRKVCDMKSYTVLLGGFFATFIVYSLLALIFIFLAYKIFKINFKDVFFIVVFGIFLDSIRTAAFDFSSILTCVIIDVKETVWQYIFLYLPYLIFLVFLILWFIIKKSD